jgi:Flp pilus assembly protein TadD
LRTKGPQQGLIDALYSKNQLKIEYDSAKTRNAAQTFAERAGNCLSLMIMTAALAKELRLTVHYQSVLVDEVWSRSGGLYFAIGHVNLIVGTKYHDIRSRIDDNAYLTIDFLPLGETRGQRSWSIDENTVIAMYMNNRAAEVLARGQVDEAYWWAREAIRQDPAFLSSYNTLGVVYRRHGNLPEAERALAHAFSREPDNLQVMSNLATVLGDQGRVAEAKTLLAKLEQKRPFPPYHYFNQGVAAMQAGDFRAARDMFSKEVGRDAYNHEFHFWLAAAYAKLGDNEQARRHLATAMEFSNTRQERDLYASKLDRISAFH